MPICQSHDQPSLALAPSSAFLGAGDYDFYMAKAGYTFETLTGVQGHGTMAQQDANAVAITGGSATLTGGLEARRRRRGRSAVRRPMWPRADRYNYLAMAPRRRISGDAQRGWRGAGHASRAWTVGIRYAPRRTASSWCRRDTGGCAAVHNAAVAPRRITTTARRRPTTPRSDARSKDNCGAPHRRPGPGAALNPVSFLWKADGTPGRGFLAHEVAEVVDGVITGERTRWTRRGRSRRR